MAFNTSKQGQHKYKLSLQYLEMVQNYKYLGITIDSQLTFTCHVSETKHRLQIQQDQGHHKFEDRSQHEDAHDSIQVLDTVCYLIHFSGSPTGLRLSTIVLRKNT